MPIREEMQSLTQEIIRSYEDRTAGITQLKQDVGITLKDLDEARATMSKELKADLAKGASQLKQDVGITLKDLDEARAGARDEWQKLAATMQARRRGLAVEVKLPEAPPPAKAAKPRHKKKG